MAFRGLRLAAVGAAIVALGCSPSVPRGVSDGNWVGTVSTEGGVTTVVNESGSVWGGCPRLVEESSIGVAAGADEYMLGAERAVYGTDDHTYVIDYHLNLVRRYDLDGVFVEQIGRIGGRGEYTDHPRASLPRRDRRLNAGQRWRPLRHRTNSS